MTKKTTYAKNYIYTLEHNFLYLELATTYSEFLIYGTNILVFFIVLDWCSQMKITLQFAIRYASKVLTNSYKLAFYTSLSPNITEIREQYYFDPSISKVHKDIYLNFVSQFEQFSLTYRLKEEPYQEYFKLPADIDRNNLTTAFSDKIAIILNIL
jgi:hypothetical protein